MIFVFFQFYSVVSRGSRIIIIIIIIPAELFPPVLDDRLSLESKWQQVSSSLLDPSQYSRQS